MFFLRSDYETAGDQQQAIDMLVEQLENGKERCILVGGWYVHTRSAPAPDQLRRGVRGGGSAKHAGI